jgi:hypothetical protein
MCVSVRVAENWELPFIIRQYRKWSNHAGFLPISNILGLLDRHRCMIVFADGLPVGSIVLSGGVRLPATLRLLAIDREWHGRGFGMLAALWVRDWCAASYPYDHMIVRTREDLVAMAAINRRLGGRVVRREPHVGARGFFVEVWHVPLSRASLFR